MVLLSVILDIKACASSGNVATKTDFMFVVLISGFKKAGEDR